MAKNIKALKCPQCGSVKHQTVKEDHYLCSHCGTEYFLDNDDINVHVKHSYQNNGNPWSIETVFQKKYLPFYIIALVLCCLLPIIFNFIGGSSSHYQTSTYAVGENPKEAPKYYESVYRTYFLVDSIQQTPILLFHVKRSYYAGEEKPDEAFLRFYNWEAQKTIKEIPIKEWNASASLDGQQFSNGILYLIPDKTNQVFAVNLQQKTIEDVTTEFFSKVPELGSGIATLKFYFKGEGDGFRIMSNDGKEYTYFPLSKRLFKDTYSTRQAAKGKASLLPSPEELTQFVFTEKSSDYPDEKIQLIRYKYLYNKGNPMDYPYKPSWKKEYQTPKGSGIFIGNFPYKKILFTDSRITDFKDISPDRLYFEPKVLFQDGTNLLISTLPNANPEGTRMIQRIDPISGQIIWTYNPTFEQFELYEEAFAYPGGAIMSAGRKKGNFTERFLFQVDNTGKLVKDISTEKLFQ